MRTTLTLDEDVAQTAKGLAAKLHQPFKKIINNALRYGLQQIENPATRKPYRTVPRHMGLREGITIDNIQEVISRIEGEESR